MYSAANVFAAETAIYLRFKEENSVDFPIKLKMFHGKQFALSPNKFGLIARIYSGGMYFLIA